MVFNLIGVRQSETDRVPCGERGVTFIHISADGTIRADKTVIGKRQILDSFRKGDLLLAAWTGQWSTDIFELDAKVVAKQFR